MYITQKRLAKETYTSQKRPMLTEKDLYMRAIKKSSQKRPIHVKRDLCVFKESYVTHDVERDLYQ